MSNKATDLKSWILSQLDEIPDKMISDRMSRSERLQLWGRKDALKEVLATMGSIVPEENPEVIEDRVMLLRGLTENEKIFWLTRDLLTARCTSGGWCGPRHDTVETYTKLARDLLSATEMI